MALFLRGLDATYTAVMHAFWYGLFFGVWPVLGMVVVLLWARGFFG